MAYNISFSVFVGDVNGKTAKRKSVNIFICAEINVALRKSVSFLC